MLEQLGIHYEVYALPQYYYLKIPDITGDFYLDPFDSGKLVKPEEFQKKFKSVLQKNRMISTNLFEKVTPQQLVGRLIQQIKHIFILKSDALLALRSVELLSALFPESPEITRDRGILYCEMEYFSKAMEDLRFYLKKRPNADDVQEIKKLTTMLKGYREVMN
jgi:regulator of sirC expression with transglutaminase-like and TPR domain